MFYSYKTIVYKNEQGYEFLWRTNILNKNKEYTLEMQVFLSHSWRFFHS